MGETRRSGNEAPDRKCGQELAYFVYGQHKSQPQANFVLILLLLHDFGVALYNIQHLLHIHLLNKYLLVPSYARPCRYQRRQKALPP